MKTAGPSDLFSGIRALLQGETYLQPSLGVEIARWQRLRDASLNLSEKERTVLELLVAGHTNLEIACQCCISVRTVETHRARIYQKLNRRTRSELVRYAQEIGLL